MHKSVNGFQKQNRKSAKKCLFLAKTHYETIMRTYTAALAILFDHVSKYGELKVSMVTLYSVVKHNMPINGKM